MFAWVSIAPFNLAHSHTSTEVCWPGAKFPEVQTSHKEIANTWHFYSFSFLKANFIPYTFVFHY